MIGSLLLIVLFLVSGGRFHFKSNSKDVIFIVLSGMAMGTSWMFLYEAYQQIVVSFASLLYYCGSVASRKNVFAADYWCSLYIGRSNGGRTGED